MLRAALSLACFFACLPAAVRAQDRTVSVADSADVLVLDHDFTAPNEVTRVFLQKGQVYRAELSSSDVSLQIRAVVRNTQLPRIYPFLNSDTPSGTSIVEVYPEADAEYEIRSVSTRGSAVLTRMRLYRDVKASQRRQLVRNSRGWEIGMEVAGGWHSGFVQSSDPLSFGGDQASGTDAEACFTAHGGPGFSRLGLCVVGLGYQSQHDARGILWIYTEPRLRLLGRVRPGESSWELGALFRFGLGMISRSPDTPTILGPGVYVARNLRHAPGASRWTLQASYSHATFRGFSRPIGSSEKRNPASDRLTLGIGWYR